MIASLCSILDPKFYRTKYFNLALNAILALPSCVTDAHLTRNSVTDVSSSVPDTLDSFPRQYQYVSAPMVAQNSQYHHQHLSALFESFHPTTKFLHIRIFITSMNCHIRGSVITKFTTHMFWVLGLHP